MSYKGLDLAPYLQNFASQLQEGYKAKNAIEAQQIQRDKQRMFAQNMPENLMTDANAYNQTVVGAFDSGLDSLGQKLILDKFEMQGKAAAKGTGAQPIGLGRAAQMQKAFGLTQSQTEYIATLPEKDAQSAVPNSLRYTTEQRGQANASRMEKRDVINQRMGTVRDIENAVKDETKQLDKLSTIIGFNGDTSQAVDAARLSTAARTIGMEVGALSDEDKRAIVSATGYGSFTQLSNYLTGQNKGSITPGVRAELDRIFLIARDTVEQRKSLKAQQTLDVNLAAKREILSSNDPMIAPLNAKYKMGGGGNATAGPTAEGKPIDTKQFNVIKDDTLRSQIMRIAQDKNLTPEELKLVLERARVKEKMAGKK